MVFFVSCAGKVIWSNNKQINFRWPELCLRSHYGFFVEDYKALPDLQAGEGGQRHQSQETGTGPPNYGVDRTLMSMSPKFPACFVYMCAYDIAV